MTFKLSEDEMALIKPEELESWDEEVAVKPQRRKFSLLVKALERRKEYVLRSSSVLKACLWCH